MDSINNMQRTGANVTITNYERSLVLKSNNVSLYEVKQLRNNVRQKPITKSRRSLLARIGNPRGMFARSSEKVVSKAPGGMKWYLHSDVK